MDLRLHAVVNHPKSASTRAEYAISTNHPRIVAAAADLLVDYDTTTNAIRATVRTSSRVEKLVYVGASRALLAFLDNGYIASYADDYSHLRFLHERKIGGTGRGVTLGKGSPLGHHALYVKADSPSLWCITVASDGQLAEPFKLRGDIEGDQENVNFIDGVFAKVRGKVASKPRARVCPIVSIAIHPSFPLAAAAYQNGILRVWDIQRKQQRNYFDAQLLLGEKVVQIDLHPHLPVLALCTTHGRVLTFNVKSGIFKRTDEPALASSKMRDKKRRFSAMCFTLGTPSYLLLLTASRRIIVRMVSNAYVLVNSSLFSKPSRLTVPVDGALRPGKSMVEEMGSTSNEGTSGFSLQWDPVVGFLVCTLDRTGSVYVFHRTVDGLPAINKPLTAGLDTGFSESSEDALAGPVLVYPDTIIMEKNNLFSYELGSERITFLATLPHGDIRRLEIARDEYGICIACLVFYCGDDEVDMRSYVENGQPLRYVLCTKRGGDESWNVSEPSEGRSGCFLGAAGVHDRIMILGNSGNTTSLFSFAGKTSREGQFLRQSRGVQRYKLLGNRAIKVFRTPFAYWSAVLYHDIDDSRLTLSRNATQTGKSDDDIGSSYAMDGETSVELSEDEVVLDVRWQRVQTMWQGEDHHGAILTDKRIYFVRGVLRLYGKFELQGIRRMVAPLAPPSFCWVGPSVVLTYGNCLFSVTIDGSTDLIAGLSRSRNLSAVVVALPTRVVYVTPSSGHGIHSVSVASRPYSGLSGLIRGILSLPGPKERTHTNYTDTITSLLGSHDVSQCSLELSDTLIKNNLASVVCLIAVSEQGRHALPPLRRAALLGRLGDIRSAIAIAESEYARLMGPDILHEGTELYRYLQRLLNMAFAFGDFAAARRCSSLLGKKGTFAAFLDCEGGHAAVSSLVDTARIRQKKYVFQVMRPIIEKSAASSIATGSSLVASVREVEGLRRAVRGMNAASVSLGTVNKSRVFVTLRDGRDESNEGPSVTRVELPALTFTDISDRLEMFRRDCEVQVPGSESFVASLDGDNIASSMNYALPAKPEGELGVEEGLDSSDEDELFVTGGGASHGDGHSSALTTDVSKPLTSQSNLQQLDDHIRQTSPPLQDPQQESARIIVAQAQQTRALMVAQRQPVLAGLPIPESRAMQIFERAVGKYAQARFSSAQKELDMALRSIGRGHQRGIAPSAELLSNIVYYQMACRIRIAMEEIASSTHANTLAGRVTYGQLAAALSRLPLGAGHRVEALVLAVDANLLLNNFGSAAEGLKLVKELGVPPDIRSSLRDKYSVCAARGFLDSVPQPAPTICYMTLKGIGINGRGLRCALCPAVFSPEAAIIPGSDCPCCGIGVVQVV